MVCGAGGASQDQLPGLLPLDFEQPELQGVFCSGEIENDFQVEKDPIARGKFASVRLARSRQTGEVFAAKFVRRRRRRPVTLEQEARHEIAVLLMGRSTPYIAQLHHVYESATEYIIILELGEGGDLQRLLDDQSRLPEKTVRELLRQILQGLNFLHQRSIAHLDLKPQNVVLMRSGVEFGVKLVDFGLSRVIHRNAELTQIMGTPDYVAPEVINFEPIGLATDMWSIGVLTYVLLTGYTPFGGENDQETFVNITQAEYDFHEEYFDGVSDLAKEFISSLLIKSPHQRMSVDQCLAHPWLYDVLDPHRLSQLSEADSADSGYSTDLCNSNPPSPEVLSNSSRPDLCHFPIPEDEDQKVGLPTNQGFPVNGYSRKSFENVPLNHLNRNEIQKRSKVCQSKVCSAPLNLNLNILDPIRREKRENYRSFRQQTRGTSLVIPRHTHKPGNLSPIGVQNFDSFAKDSKLVSNKNGLINACNHSYYDSDVSDVSDIGTRPKLSSFFLSQDIRPRKCKRNCNQNYPIDLNPSLESSLPSKRFNSYNGNHNSPVNLSQPTRKLKVKTNLGLRPELSYSMFELNPSCENNNLTSSQNGLRSPKSRKSTIGLGTSQSRSGSASKGISPQDMKTPRKERRGDSSVNYDWRKCQSDSRAPRPMSSQFNPVNLSLDDGKSNSNVRKHLFVSPTYAAVPSLDVSLSRLDIAREKAINDLERDEERDIVYGDYTLPRRPGRLREYASTPGLLGGNSFHMSFRRPRKKDNKI